MTKKDKLVARFLTMPRDFHFNELVVLLHHFGFKQSNKGKTSGSRVKFENSSGIMILLHRPHPNGVMKIYQLKQIKEKLAL